MHDATQKAVDYALTLNNHGRGDSMGLAIYKASKRFGIQSDIIASAMASRRREKAEIGQIKKTLSAAKNKEKLYRSIPEKCRDCGADIGYRQEKCDLCGADTRWIWEIAQRIDEI